MVPDLIPVPGHIFNSRPLFFSLSLSFSFLFFTVAALSIRGTARSGFRPPCVYHLRAVCNATFYGYAFSLYLYAQADIIIIIC